MTPHPSVLIGYRPRGTAEEALRARIVAWVRDLGFDTALAEDGLETRSRVHRHVFAATLLDSAMLEGGVTTEIGTQVWRSVHPVLGRRLVLMVREVPRGLWFEALRDGVGAVLPLPPREGMVRAALRAATGGFPPGDDRGAGPA